MTLEYAVNLDACFVLCGSQRQTLFSCIPLQSLWLIPATLQLLPRWTRGPVVGTVTPELIKMAEIQVPERPIGA
ncbi:hypothetical protein CYMTET_25188 [Cymbomonas tetramitiformis]|uniref:Uncharacterized protein n=1 Tax=Cymbomonas tetramitiformis TaxID=36881 RepID=A0AAE0KZA4_9CHLO|nr:hypothetical protein CYMTET_25188 [Cymbomonas tetramitiformis]